MDKILIDELNKFTNNEYKFALKSALLQSNADFCVIEIFYKDGILLSIEKKKNCKSCVWRFFQKHSNMRLFLLKISSMKKELKTTLMRLCRETFRQFHMLFKKLRLKI